MTRPRPTGPGPKPGSNRPADGTGDRSTSRANGAASDAGSDAGAGAASAKGTAKPPGAPSGSRNGSGNGHSANGEGAGAPIKPAMPPSAARSSRMAMARRAIGDTGASTDRQTDANLDYGDRPASANALLIDTVELPTGKDRLVEDHLVEDHPAEAVLADDPPVEEPPDFEVLDLNRLSPLDLDEVRARRSPQPASTLTTSPDASNPAGRKRRSAVSAQRRRVVAALFFAWMMIVVGIIAGFLYAEAQPDMWAAEAEIVLEPRSSQIDRFLATEVVWIASSTVIDRAASAVGVDRDYINEHLNVSTIDASTAVGVQFVDEDPALAIDVVTAVVDSYLADVRNQPVSTTRSVYSARIDELRSARAAIEVDLASVERSNAAAEEAGQAIPFPTEQRRLTLESEEILGQISGLEQQLIVTDIEILSQAQATVVTPSHLLDERVAPTPITFAALGALTGGALAAATIFLVGRRRSQTPRPS